MLHGVHGLPRAMEIVPGVYVGGEAAATALVTPNEDEGGPRPSQFKFFSGAG